MAGGCSWAVLLARFLNNMPYIKTLSHTPKPFLRSLLRFPHEGGGPRLLRERRGKITTYASLYASTWIIPAFAGKPIGVIDNNIFMNIT